MNRTHFLSLFTRLISFPFYFSQVREISRQDNTIDENGETLSTLQVITLICTMFYANLIIMSLLGGATDVGQERSSQSGRRYGIQTK